MIATPTAPTAVYRFIPHGRPPQRPSAAAAPGLDIFEIARQRAREFGRVTFVISHWGNNHWNVRFADGLQLAPDDIIEFVAWPPGWRYRPQRRNSDGRQ